MGREFWRCSLGPTSCSICCFQEQSWGRGCSFSLAPQLCPNLTQSVRGPDGPVAVGFGEAWRQGGALFRRRREGCQ